MHHPGFDLELAGIPFRWSVSYVKNEKRSFLNANILSQIWLSLVCWLLHCCFSQWNWVLSLDSKRTRKLNSSKIKKLIFMKWIRFIPSKIGELNCKESDSLILFQFFSWVSYLFQIIFKIKFRALLEPISQTTQDHLFGIQSVWSLLYSKFGWKCIRVVNFKINHKIAFHKMTHYSSLSDKN